MYAKNYNTSKVTCNTSSTGYSYKAALEDGSESEWVPSNKSLNIYRVHVH